MKQILFQKYITRQDLKDNPDRIYVFGDNDCHVGLGGQAKEMRGEPNAVGIRTKKTPKTGSEVYYYDDDIVYNMYKISEDFIVVYEYLLNGKTVVFPEDGIGTGLAKLKENAPQTLLYIEGVVKVLYDKFGK